MKQHTKEGEEPSEVCLLKSIFKSEKYKLISKWIVFERANEKKQHNAIIFYKGYDLSEKIKI